MFLYNWEKAWANTKWQWGKRRLKAQQSVGMSKSPPHFSCCNVGSLHSPSSMTRSWWNWFPLWSPSHFGSSWTKSWVLCLCCFRRCNFCNLYSKPSWYVWFAVLLRNPKKMKTGTLFLVCIFYFSRSVSLSSLGGSRVMWRSTSFLSTSYWSISVLYNWWKIIHQFSFVTLLEGLSTGCKWSLWSFNCGLESPWLNRIMHQRLNLVNNWFLSKWSLTTFFPSFL